jgi:dihydrofolate reductase
MGKVIAYIATSLDGFIAEKNDDLSWLAAYNIAGEDHGYAEFMENVGTAVLGARTYDQSRKHPERMLYAVKNYVLSEAPMAIPSGLNVAFYDGDIAELVEHIKDENDKDIFVVGGGRVISSFLNAHLVDELLQFVAPVLIREGIPLYSGLADKINLRLVDALPYKTGIVRLRYVPNN